MSGCLYSYEGQLKHEKQPLLPRLLRYGIRNFEPTDQSLGQSTFQL